MSNNFCYIHTLSGGKYAVYRGGIPLSMPICTNSCNHGGVMW